MSMAKSNNDAYTDVVELCALLQCLGFSVKSLDTADEMSQDGAGSSARTVVINCPASGLHVVMESTSTSCSCPAASPQNSGMWQVSGVAQGKHLDKEFGCNMLGSLPKAHRNRLTAELQEMIRCIKQHNESDCENRKENKSASVTDLKTPEKLQQELRVETPTRYRSLDTLTSKTLKESDELPIPGVLQRARLPSGCEDKGLNSKMCGRQGTYTLSSTPDVSGGVSRKNRTSSPIQLTQNYILDTLVTALKSTEEVHSTLGNALRKLMDDVLDDSSMSSLALDVSKISVVKPESSTSQFASSPNLSSKVGLDDTAPGSGMLKKHLSAGPRRYESASTSNLDQRLNPKESKLARLRRISPNIFNKDTTIKADKGLDGKNKLRNLLKPKIATPVRVPQKKTHPEPSPNLSRNKYSHIKSTIPRPTKKE